MRKSLFCSMSIDHAQDRLSSTLYARFGAIRLSIKRTSSTGSMQVTEKTNIVIMPHYGGIQRNAYRLKRSCISSCRMISICHMENKKPICNLQKIIISATKYERRMRSSRLLAIAYYRSGYSTPRVKKWRLSKYEPLLSPLSDPPARV